MLFDHETPTDFVYLEVNSAFEKLTGLKDVAGKKVGEVIPDIRESNPELFKTYGRVALTARPERFETYVDAMGIWFSISVYSPSKEHFVAVFDNITERKRVQQALERGEQLMRAVVDGSSDAIFVKDRDGRYLLFNESAERFVGREASAVIGHDDSFIFPAEVAKELMALDRSIMEAGERQTHEEYLSTLAGENIIFLVTNEAATCCASTP
jgi:PAS domain S-box-containing protein